MLTRILVGLVGIPIVIGIVALGGWFFNGAVIIITTLALVEFYRLAAAKNTHPNVLVGISLSLAVQLLLGFAIGARDDSSFPILLALLPVVVTGILITVLVELWRNHDGALLNTATTALGVCYICGGLSALMLMGRMDFSHDIQGAVGIHYAFSRMKGEASGFLQGLHGSLVLVFFASIWICDSAAYFIGKAIGRHKLFPRISPNKSWEGAIGGFVFAVVAFAVLGSYVLPGMDLANLVACGVVVGVFGQLGDLVESMFKRDALVKDSSHIIPGHGGMLDRFDSILIAAPAVLLYLFISYLLMYSLTTGRS